MSDDDEVAMPRHRPKRRALRVPVDDVPRRSAVSDLPPASDVAEIAGRNALTASAAPAVPPATEPDTKRSATIPPPAGSPTSSFPPPPRPSSYPPPSDEQQVAMRGTVRIEASAASEADMLDPFADMPDADVDPEPLAPESTQVLGEDDLDIVAEEYDEPDSVEVRIDELEDDEADAVVRAAMTAGVVPPPSAPQAARPPSSPPPPRAETADPGGLDLDDLAGVAPDLGVIDHPDDDLPPIGLEGEATTETVLADDDDDEPELTVSTEEDLDDDEPELTIGSDLADDDLEELDDDEDDELELDDEAIEEAGPPTLPPEKAAPPKPPESAEKAAPPKPPESVEKAGPPKPPESVEKAAPPKPPEAPAAPPQKKKRRKPWFEGFFSDDYLRTVRPATPKEIARECDFIVGQLGLPRGATILDVGCGLGLHAIELTRRGYLVVGLDLSLPMLSRAGDEAQDEGLRINFLHGDMRQMTFEGQFDAVLCWGTTFGYFDDEGNAEVVQRLLEALKPGGLLLLDIVNRDHVIADQPNLVWFEGDGCVCMEESRFDYLRSRLHVKRTVILDDGRQRENTYSLRLYAPHEIGKLLHQKGFRVAKLSGMQATPGVFFGTASPQLIILAERRPESVASPTSVSRTTTKMMAVADESGEHEALPAKATEATQPGTQATPPEDEKSDPPAPPLEAKAPPSEAQAVEPPPSAEDTFPESPDAESPANKPDDDET